MTASHFIDMKIVRTVSEMQRTADDLRKTSKIGLVPTMGYLHEGHLTLVRAARKIADVVVVSIFVNPIQFGPSEDLARYPRNFERDAKFLEQEKTDIVFYPDDGQMYEKDFSTYVEAKKLEDHLCGKTRTGHFTGVATVVTKLFNIVKPHYAVFGQKDYQQLVIIERMVRDLNIDVEIVPHPTVREADGLAMSSRNQYLSTAERAVAAALHRTLLAMRAGALAGQPRARVEAEADAMLRGAGFVPDYAVLRRPDFSEPTDGESGPQVALIAARLGRTRLIDNLEFERTAAA